LSAREDRIARDQRREHVRLALRSAAAHGYYVFDELITENAGMIDFLAIGPVGAIVVIVRDEAGKVTADVDGMLYLNGRTFDDSPNTQGVDLVEDVYARLPEDACTVYHVICFTRAELFYLGENQEALRGVSPTWDLPLAFEEAEREHTPADVTGLADLISEAYARPPFVVPREGKF
jgi:hypothetical protein